MAAAADRCAHCDTAIVDPTTRIVHGEMTYCCANCAAAMEQGGSGSDPNTLEVAGDFRCSHCSAVIVDESTMASRGDRAFCCPNCAAADERDPEGVAPGSGNRLPAEDRPRNLR